MIITPLFKRSFKANYKLFLIFLGVLLMYFTMIIAMYDPTMPQKMEELFELMPKGIMLAMGFTLIDPSLLGFISSYLYGFLVIVFPMVYIIILSNNLITSHVDKGSMAYILATPNPRKKVLITQIVYLLGSVLLLIALITIIGIVVSTLIYPRELNILKFILINIGVFCLHIAISGICFFASCISDETKKSAGISTSIVVGFYLIQMLANVGGNLEVLKYFTMFSLFNPSEIINQNLNSIWMLALLVLIGSIFFVIGFNRFVKRDLPL